MIRNKRNTFVVVLICLFVASCKSISYDSDGFARVEKKGKIGLLDKDGKVVLPYTFENIGIFQEDIAVAKKNGAFGIITPAGKVVAPFKYSSIRREPGFFVVSETVFMPADQGGNVEHYSLMNYSGKSIGDNNYRTITAFQNDEILGTYASVLNFSGSYGIIDKNGREIIPCGAEEPIVFNSEGYAIVKQKGKYGIIDRNAQTLLSIECSTPEDAEEAFKNRWIWGTWKEKPFVTNSGVTVFTYHFYQNGTCGINCSFPDPMLDQFLTCKYKVRNDEVTVTYPNGNNIVLMRLYNKELGINCMVTNDKYKRELNKIRNN